MIFTSHMAEFNSTAAAFIYFCEVPRYLWLWIQWHINKKGAVSWHFCCLSSAYFIDQLDRPLNERLFVQWPDAWVAIKSTRALENCILFSTSYFDPINSIRRTFQQALNLQNVSIGYFRKRPTCWWHLAAQLRVGEMSQICLVRASD